DGIIDRCKHVRTIYYSYARTQFSRKLIFVPDRKIVVRDLCDLASGRCSRGRARDKRVLKGISAGNRPRTRNISVQTDLKTVCALAAGLNYPRRIIRIGRTRVRSGESVERRG